MKKWVTLSSVEEDWSRALAVVAHPDDMEYGAAGAIARWTSQGKQVDYLLITHGEAGIDSMTPKQAAVLREKEQMNSARAVGVNNVEFLKYRDGVVEYGLDLRKDIARVIRRLHPEVLITINHHLTFGGIVLNMADHRWVGLAVLDAVRDACNRWIFTELLEEGLDPWCGVRFVCIAGSPYPTHAVDVTNFLEKGIESLNCHKVYIENLPTDFDAEAFLRKDAEETGKRFGAPYAVGFEVIRF